MEKKRSEDPSSSEGLKNDATVKRRKWVRQRGQTFVRMSVSTFQLFIMMSEWTQPSSFDGRGDVLEQLTSSRV